MQLQNIVNANKKCITDAEVISWWLRRSFINNFCFFFCCCYFLFIFCIIFLFMWMWKAFGNQAYQVLMQWMRCNEKFFCLFFFCFVCLHNNNIRYHIIVYLPIVIFIFRSFHEITHSIYYRFSPNCCLFDFIFEHNLQLKSFCVTQQSNKCCVKWMNYPKILNYILSTSK